MRNRNLDGSDLEFLQDSKLSFDEAEHKYFVEDLGEMTPVSTVISHFFKPFDAMYWSLRKSHGDEVAAARMRDEWECKGFFASRIGTFMHKQIEEFLNGKAEPELEFDANYKGEFINESRHVNIRKEWQYFQAFNHEVTFQPFRTEWGVYDAFSRVAGTIDLICACSDGTYEIYDWKRSNKIDPSEFNKWSSGINGLEHLTDTSYRHYCLQQNLYRYIVEKNYGLKISRMNLVVLHPDFGNYDVVPIPVMDKEVQTILKHIG